MCVGGGGLKMQREKREGGGRGGGREGAGAGTFLLFCGGSEREHTSFVFSFACR